MSTLLTLCLEFLKTGLFAIGGGPATIPFLNEMCSKYDWFTQEELTTMIAVSETTPGPVGINMATYVGYTTCGIIGGICATLSLVLPSIVVITIIAHFLAAFQENKIVKDAFFLIRPAVTALIATAVIGLIQDALFCGEGRFFGVLAGPAILFGIIVGLLQIKKLSKIHPFFWFVAAAAAGIIFRM